LGAIVLAHELVSMARPVFFCTENIVPTQIQIRTDADYLKAHVTVIHPGDRGVNFVIQGIRQRFLSHVKKWIWATGAGKA
jgi:hypothetical protein